MGKTTCFAKIRRCAAKKSPIDAFGIDLSVIIHALTNQARMYGERTILLDRFENNFVENI